MVLIVGLLPAVSCAQSSTAAIGSPVQLLSPKGDTLSALLFAVKEGFAAKTTDERSHVYIGWLAYRFNGKRVYFSRANRLYSVISDDPDINQLYLEQKGNRKLGLVGATAGGALMLAGGITLVTRLDKVLLVEEPNYGWSGGLFIGGILSSLVGIVALEVSLNRSRQAVKLYHDRYMAEKTAVSIELGSPTSTPAGVALYLRF